MTGLLGTVVDAAIGWLVQSILGSFFTGQMEAWTREIGLAKDVENLKFEMTHVEMVLAAAKGRMTGNNEPLARSLDEFKELLYDSEDVMDELDYYRLQQQIEEGKGCSAPIGTNPEGIYVSSPTPSSAFELVRTAISQITNWASCDRKRKRQEEGPAHSTMLTFEIHDISKRINEIVNRLRTIGNYVKGVLQLEISRPIATSSESQNVARNARLTTSVPIEYKVYGRDAERDKIIELLTNEEYSDLNVLPVVGIGGVGKTTLVRFVYNDERIKDHFDLRMWVCVSTNFNEMRLTLEILEHVCEDRQEYEKVSNFNVLQDKLLKYIRNKRFLLVLDDVWEDRDRSGWVKLLAPLKRNQGTGCMILATTRRKSVAKMIGTVVEFEVNGLDEKEFWLFFRACAFGNENCEDHPSLQSIGQQIAKALKGCPLAARSVGALLYTSVSYEHWRTVQDKWKSLQEEDDILPILKLSYDYLPVHLQKCFSYCSLFPEDHPFNGEILVRAWISQNFVQCEDPTMRLEETGQQYLNRLVDLGFFQKVGSHYVMHDLMHELAEKVSSNECATIHGLKPKAIRPSVRHLSIITTAFDKDEHGCFPSEKFDKILQSVRPSQKLRTLMLFGRSSINLLSSLHTFCKEAKYLRFLRIYVTGADMSSIYSLLHPCHLRYLEFVFVPTTNISVYGVYNKTAFPLALTRFYHLQVLDVGSSGNLAVPTGMNKLVNLRHLIAHEEVHCAIACVGNMTSLQELIKFKVQNVGSFEISQLQSMNELVLLGISQLENVKTKEEARAVKLIDKEYLEKLSLSWKDSSMSLEPETAKDVLEGLQPHQKLKTLEITGYSGATSPTWLSSNFSVTSLQILRLEKCREWRILSLEMLPFLRKLTLIRMLNLVEIPIPSLEELVLIDMPKLEKCSGSYGVELTSRLRVLMIKNCPQLNEFTVFQSYSSFDAEQKSWFPSLRKLSIGRCPHIMWETLPLREMGKLKELELMDLHVVRELSVPSLEKLVLIKMPSLEICSGLTASPAMQFLPSQRDQKAWSSSLRRLTIHDCPCLTVSHPLPPSISELSIRGVQTRSSITHRWFTIKSYEFSVLDDGILAFHHNLRAITLLTIENCPNLISLSGEGFSRLIALEYICISSCPNLLTSNIMSEAIQENNMFGSRLVLPSLKVLHIQSCGIAGWWLTQMIRRSQCLEKLTVGNCPQIKLLSISQPTEMEGTSGSASTATAMTSSGQDEQLLKIPFNMLSSLKRLDILNCPDLEFCGGEGSFGGFTSLVELIIDGCPKLVSSLVGDSEDGTVDVGLLPPSLQYLWISHLPPNLQSYNPEGLLYLRKLHISSSPDLKSVQLRSFTALEELGIWKCEHLAVLEGLQFLSSLRSLKVSMNLELSSAWDLKLQEQEQGSNKIQLLPPSLEELQILNLTDGLQSRLLSCLPPITKLVIRGSPELTYVQLGFCTALEELEIGDCGLLASIEGFQSIRNLSSLKLHDSPCLPSCLELASSQQGASEIWSGLETLEISDASVLSMSFCKLLTSLRRLRFFPLGSTRREGMVSLTEEQERSFQFLTSLQELTFFMHENLLSLPANLYSLTSLERLHVWYCPSISRLPEKGLPPSLGHLVLDCCSDELGMQCRNAATKKLHVTIDNETVN